MGELPRNYAYVLRFKIESSLVLQARRWGQMCHLVCWSLVVCNFNGEGKMPFVIGRSVCVSFRVVDVEPYKIGHALHIIFMHFHSVTPRLHSFSLASTLFLLFFFLFFFKLFVVGARTLCTKLCLVLSRVGFFHLHT